MSFSAIRTIQTFLVSVMSENMYVLRYGTKEEFNVDSKAEWSA